MPWIVGADDQSKKKKRRYAADSLDYFQRKQSINPDGSQGASQYYARWSQDYVFTPAGWLKNRRWLDELTIPEPPAKKAAAAKRKKGVPLRWCKRKPGAQRR